MPNQSLFLVMSPSTNIRSYPTTSTKTTTLDLDPPTSSHVTQTDLFNTINVILSKFDDKYTKREAKFNEYVNEKISNQYAKFDNKL